MKATLIKQIEETKALLKKQQRELIVYERITELIYMIEKNNSYSKHMNMEFVARAKDKEIIGYYKTREEAEVYLEQYNNKCDANVKYTIITAKMGEADGL